MNIVSDTSAHLAWLGLGTNKGDLLLNLANSVIELSRLPETSLQAVSPVYESKPVGEGYTRNFLNAAICLRTGLSPDKLLVHCLKVENQFGRSKREGDRSLDIDLLFFDEEIISADCLVIPHPRLHLRRFVLEPLTEIEPDLIHPLLEKTVSELLNQTQIQSQIVVKLHQPLLPAWGC